ncbi:hypothetical protein Kpol_1058p13 [Vanderwaltozyma polyspora DSM 70294]|uniref:rRNA-processing protein FYV7 n=1 Tax=Vanderwaltozyma polyspora (strain ATCC 22028 / DSM 70294 / BCRC 21397 / CBS 2163 / NBRC 10782 / NRRL Y-8283 / UCD 57-17) TaxID=436907 RepID=A7TJP7_VANPO|nr:uncharacterized protein Kpol_1058p13 [Vanderwaltozyma polyspora DSM 70294]EDO17476.1 hypothetical protein Kpol_1058p13 [Vanderwaltozyma polyspora DSM 70294]
MATAKQQENRKKFTKEYKVKEIKKSLTRKARLKKEYLKALHDEGYSVPEKQPGSGAGAGGARDYKSIKAARTEANKQRAIEMKVMKRERKMGKKQHFEQSRKDEMANIAMLKQKEVDREKRKKKMTQRTRTGQPKMGPKIDDLLSKIKSDDTYTL